MLAHHPEHRPSGTRFAAALGCRPPSGWPRLGRAPPGANLEPGPFWDIHVHCENTAGINPSGWVGHAGLIKIAPSHQEPPKATKKPPRIRNNKTPGLDPLPAGHVRCPGVDILMARGRRSHCHRTYAHCAALGPGKGAARDIQLRVTAAPATTPIAIAISGYGPYAAVTPAHVATCESVLPVATEIHIISLSLMISQNPACRESLVVVPVWGHSESWGTGTPLCAQGHSECWGFDFKI